MLLAGQIEGVPCVQVTMGARHPMPADRAVSDFSIRTMQRLSGRTRPGARPGSGRRGPCSTEGKSPAGGRRAPGARPTCGATATGWHRRMPRWCGGWGSSATGTGARWPTGGRRGPCGGGDCPRRPEPMAAALPGSALHGALFGNIGTGALFAGAAGTRAAMGPAPPAVRARLAAALGLAAQVQTAGVHCQQREGAAWFAPWPSLHGLCLAAGRMLAPAAEVAERLHPDPAATARAGRRRQAGPDRGAGLRAGRDHAAAGGGARGRAAGGRGPRHRHAPGRAAGAGFPRQRPGRAPEPRAWRRPAPARPRPKRVPLPRRRWRTEAPQGRRKSAACVDSRAGSRAGRSATSSAGPSPARATISPCGPAMTLAPT